MPEERGGASRDRKAGKPGHLHGGRSDARELACTDLEEVSQEEGLASARTLRLTLVESV